MKIKINTNGTSKQCFSFLPAANKSHSQNNFILPSSVQQAFLNDATKSSFMSIVICLNFSLFVFFLVY